MKLRNLKIKQGKKNRDLYKGINYFKKDFQLRTQRKR